MKIFVNVTQNLKHKMVLNRSISIGILKDELIHVLLETVPEERTRRLQAIYDELSRNVIPIRGERHYSRTKGNLASKYSNTHKRSY